MDLGSIGKYMIFGAFALLVIGLVFVLLGRFGIGRLPGDLVLQRGSLTVYFPIGLMILFSIVGTIVLNIILRR